MLPVPVPVPVPIPAAELLRGIDLRAAERFGVGMAYTLGDGQQGQTSDLSTTGLSFESRTPYVVGAIVQLTLRYSLDGHNFPLPCEAEVIRVQADQGGYLIAARFLRPFMETPE